MGIRAEKRGGKKGGRRWGFKHRQCTREWEALRERGKITVGRQEKSAPKIAGQSR